MARRPRVVRLMADPFFKVHLDDDVHLSNKSCRKHYQPGPRTGNCTCPVVRCWYLEQKARRKRGELAIHPDAWPRRT